MMELVKMRYISQRGAEKRDWIKIQHEEEDGSFDARSFTSPNWAAKAS
jgi:hypothetical protein